MQFWLGAAAIVWLLSTLRHLVDVLHPLQLQEYENHRFLQWSLTNWNRVIWPLEIAVALVLLFLLIVLDSPPTKAVVLGAVVLWGAAVIASYSLSARRQARAKKPLVYTARLKRLLVGGFLVTAGEALVILGAASAHGFSAWSLGAPAQESIILCFIFLIGLGQLSSANAVLANLLLFPLEELIRAIYVRSAKKRIRAIAPVVIGITGSFGKTSTKEILSHLLLSKYEVLKTPRSYNTLMGICKVIREDLQPRHQYFVVELGAYQRGEIAEMCRLVKPQIGILTAIGPQHLERFKTIDNIAKAKNELIAALPDTGVAIFNGDDPICLRLSKTAKNRVLRYGLTPTSKSWDLSARNVEIDHNGMRFEIVHGDKEPQLARTFLLGTHNASNILGAILAALECGIHLRQAIQSLAVLSPIEHRLQLVAGPNDVTFIDDAYNANPVGAAQALEVLAAFRGRKILVTPGLVELGSLESTENERFGRRAAKVCDYVFLVGDTHRVGPILKGLQKEGFDDGRVTLVGSLDAARQRLRDMVEPGDVILFENDLPDVY